VFRVAFLIWGVRWAQVEAQKGAKRLGKAHFGLIWLEKAPYAAGTYLPLRWASTE
jgi:hypothetical protein